MSTEICTRSAWPKLRAPLVLLLAYLVLGCSRQESADEAMERVSKETGVPLVGTVEFAGRVTIDGQPAPAQTLVILYNEEKPPRPGKSVPPYALCKDDGSFAFSTNKLGDGVAPGKYTVLFAKLRHNFYGRNGVWTEPDELHNLFNDPDTAKFHEEVAPPGKSDYLFELQTDNKEPITKPGSKAIKNLW